MEVVGDQAWRRQVRVLEVGGGQAQVGRLYAKTSTWMVSLEALVSSCETDCFGFVKPKLFESSSVGIFEMLNYIKPGQLANPRSFREADSQMHVFLTRGVRAKLL